jgi:hypothetical protein
MTWSFFGGKEQPKKSKSRRAQRKQRSLAQGPRRAHFEALEDRRVLAVFTVTNLTDAVVAPAGSLREAINNANAAAGADTIQFAAGLTGTLSLAAGAGELGITDPLSINGPGATNLTIDATAASSRIFNIGDEAGNVTLKGLTLTKGSAGLGSDGGAIFSDSLGMLTVADSVLTGNAAGSRGGGIFASGSVLVTNTTIGGVGALGNTTLSGGGGVFALGNVMVQSSTISGNSGGFGSGGGINAGGSVMLDNSTIGGAAVGAGNSALTKGGGIYAPSISVMRSTISGNAATTGNGGGIYGSGAGVVIVQNSTISGNDATAGDGGGIFASNVTLQNATVASNTAGAGSGGGVRANFSFKMQNSIAIGNTDAGTHPDLQIPAGAGSAVKFSLIGDNTGLPAGTQFTVTGPAGPANTAGNLIGMPGGGNAIPIATVLDAAGLQNNGGPTFTIALATGSPAINAGKNTLAADANKGDQRGLPFVRTSPFGGVIDMGAFEVQTPTLGNTAPVVANAIAAQTATVGNFYSLTFPTNTFTDVDGDALTYSATQSSGAALPVWLTFNDATRTFSGTPTAGDVGTITIRLTASDGKGGSVFNDFTLQVVTNPPPVVSNPIADQHATVTIPFNYVVPASTFTDPNGDPLTYTATLTGGGALPAWLSFNPGTRTFTGTPAAGDIGTISVRVTATDPQGGSAVDDFNLVVSNSELPFNENFEGTVDSRIVTKSPSFATTTTSPVNGTQSFEATRPNVGSRPVATVDFANPATPPAVTNVAVNVSTLPGNGGSLWSNAVVVFDYQSPTNYKFAGVFEIINKLIIGQVVNGKVTYLATKKFNAVSNTTIPLNVSINRTTNQVTLASGSTSVAHTFKSIGTGTVGLGTINANAKFDNLAVS